ncbi:uncharacterized protein ColSpa_10901 [Colletotrichum spaethianum]|uniref:Uncharacterized protein n=1 Tax=Colletotrichum spaethianum TaxID=700344 RepID=A0AA37PEB1_9PEZI|nr:uncharacterized protein ColSpa_10901 [Colletotrichum spaethianum]GKT50720.1 hypothetical protein ColSpa_10901 [Colletotrichum spaethianum]
MRCVTITVLGLAAIASATWDGQFSYPPGIEPLALANGNVDFNIKTFGPMTGPPEDCISVWHPPHPDVYIDDCDSDKEHGWHWIHPGKPKWWGKPGKDKDHDKPGKDKDHDKPKHPHQPCDKCNDTAQPQPTTTPQWKWTTSTITQTAVSTVFSCPPTVPDCPANGGGTMYTTVTVPAVVTICPVPVEPNPGPTTPPAAPRRPPRRLLSPPPEVPPVPSSPAEAPPATTTKPDIGTVTRPNPTATTSRAVVTAGAAQNVQRAGGVVVAAVAAVAALI